LAASDARRRLAVAASAAPMVVDVACRRWRSCSSKTGTKHFLAVAFSIELSRDVRVPALPLGLAPLR